MVIYEGFISLLINIVMILLLGLWNILKKNIFNNKIFRCIIRSNKFRRKYFMILN